MMMRVTARVLHLPFASLVVFIIAEILLTEAQPVLTRVRRTVKAAMKLHRYDQNVQAYGHRIIRVLSKVLPDEVEEKMYVKIMPGSPLFCS